MSDTKLPSIPDLPAGIDPALARFLGAIKENLLVREGAKGDLLDSVVTFRDLVDAGLATSDRYTPPKNAKSPVVPSAVTDSIPPPALEQVTATGSIASVFLAWASITNPNHSHVEVWRSLTNNLSSAVIVGRASGQMFVDYDVVAGQEYFYFLRAVSKSGTSGPFNQEAYRATPAADPENVIELLRQQGGFALQGQPFYYVPPGGVTINGQFVPEGTYIYQAVIANASITGAQIARATITDAEVQELSADKIEFDAATGKVFTAAVIFGGLISGTRFEGNEYHGGLINGATIISGGTEDLPGIHIDGENGTLTLNGERQEPGIDDSYDYTRFSAGHAIDAFYVPTVGHVENDVLTMIEVGTASHDDVVELPGFWRKEPKVLVSPNDSRIFDPTIAGTDQVLICRADNIERLSDDPSTVGYYKYRFKAKSRLTAGSGGRSLTLNQVVINQANNTALPNGYGYLSGTVDSQSFLLPTNSYEITITTDVILGEWTNLTGMEGDFNAGMVYASLYLSFDNGATWEFISTSSGFNNNPSGLISNAAMSQVATSQRTFLLPGVNASGLARIRYSFGGGPGQQRPIYNNPYEWILVRPFARRYVRLGTVGIQTNPIDTIPAGTLNWIAVA